MKSVLFAILAAVLSTAAGGVAVAGDGIYTTGLGSETCVKFLEEERKNSASNLPKGSVISDFFPYVEWMSGYMSAALTYNDIENPAAVAAVDISDRMYLVRQHCEKNPLGGFGWAVHNVAEQLIDRAGRR